MSDQATPPRRSSTVESNPGFDRFSETYRADLDEALRFSGQDADFFTRAKVRALGELVRRHVGEPADVGLLDVGCGIGLTDTMLVHDFAHVTGIDISEPLVRQAADRNSQATYDIYPGGRLPYDDHAFDAVFTFCVLHHVPEPERAGFVSELRRVTRPGGLVVIGEHNPLNPLTRFVVGRCAFDNDAVLLGAGEATTLLREAGLEPVERRFVLVVPAERPLARKMDAWLGSIPIGAQYLVAGRPI